MFTLKKQRINPGSYLPLCAIIGLIGMLSGCGGGSNGAGGSRLTPDKPGTPSPSISPAPTTTPSATPTPTPSPSPSPTPLSANYFRSVFPHWATFPLKVRFDHSVISADVEKNLRQGMDAWKSASGGKINYVLVEDDTADVTVTVANLGDALHGITEGSWFEDTNEADRTIINMTIKLSEKAVPLDAATQARIMAHEWGHALGLIEKVSPFGHSDSHADRMYPVLENLKASDPILSTRDINTMKRLYNL
jgi:hypothetical protein